MRALFKNLSLIPSSLRDKLVVAFSLMSVIPLLILVYLATAYIFPYNRDIGTISFISAMGVVIAFLGLSLAKSMIGPIVKLSAEAQRIAEGDIKRSVMIDREDEVGLIGDSLNKITERVRQNLDSLTNYGEEINKLNLKINDNILLMQNLLQLGNIISKSANIEDILELVMGRLADLPFIDAVALLMKDEETGIFNIRSSVNFNTTPGIHHSVTALFKELAATARPIIADKLHKRPSAIKQFLDVYGIENVVLSPLFLKSRLIGLMVCGNGFKDFTYQKEAIDMLQIFARQINIALENDILAKRTKELEVKDELTGLFNRKYIESHLDEEIKRAIMCQRPCSLIVFDVDDFLKFRDAHGAVLAENALKAIAINLREMTTDIDKVGRLTQDIFAVILPEKNKKDALSLAENMKDKINETRLEVDTKLKAGLTISGGVSENPIDGMSAKELMNHAIEAIKTAKLQGKGRVLG